MLLGRQVLLSWSHPLVQLLLGSLTVGGNIGLAIIFNSFTSIMGIPTQLQLESVLFCFEYFLNPMTTFCKIT